MPRGIPNKKKEDNSNVATLDPRDRPRDILSQDVPVVNEDAPELLTPSEAAEKAGGWAIYVCDYASAKIQIGKRELIIKNGVGQMVPAGMARFKNRMFKCPISWKNHVKVLDELCKIGRYNMKRLEKGNPAYDAIVKENG